MQALNFEWDESNILHLAQHQIEPKDTEEVIKNRPLELPPKEIRNGELRETLLGETDAGRILVVVITLNDTKIRVVTAMPAKKKLRNYFLSHKGSGHVGRAEN